jgi:hypothetical protein
MKAPA